MSDELRRTVTLRILGQEYRVRTDADADGVQRAAELVEDVMGRIRSRTGTADSLDLAIMTALNLARDVGAFRGADETGLRPARLRSLIDEVESALGSSRRNASP